eukprot:SAG31_NODE_270_length_18732_cov_9.342618_18_plen_176_part_00
MDNAWQCSLWGLAGIVINCLLLKPLLAHCGNRPLIMASLASQIGSQLMYILSKDKLVVMGIQNIVSAFNMMLGVCCSGLVSAYTPATEQGFALGTLSAVTSIVSILGPAVRSLFQPNTSWFERTNSLTLLASDVWKPILVCKRATAQFPPVAFCHCWWADRHFDDCRGVAAETGA